jgi:hypothetical protein
MLDFLTDPKKLEGGDEHGLTSAIFSPQRQKAGGPFERHVALALH